LACRYIKHRVNCFVVRIEEYFDILNKLNKEQIYEMSKEARIYAINNFDIRNIAKRLINYLSENGY
jgi:glycosyltransferase involved in cell wall biosynthesis